MRYYIDKYTGKLERTDVYLVRLIKNDGTVIEDLEPRRLFPFTNHTQYISLLDKKEKEIAFVSDLNELDADSRRALQECFSEYYMIPKITSLVDCYDRFGKIKWTVETDRGTISFTIRNRHSDIKRLYPTNRIIIRDSNDNRYEIVDYTKMDRRSIYLLFSYL